MSELKCCNKCGAFTTCTVKGECCPECEYFDPVDNLCMAIPERKTVKKEMIEEPVEIDPETFLFEDDDEEDDDTDLPPERESSDDEEEEDVDFGFDDDDW